ncbi:MAG: cupredoxin domain-containing protein [Actinomycetota bacterium]
MTTRTITRSITRSSVTRLVAGTAVAVFAFSACGDDDASDADASDAPEEAAEEASDEAPAAGGAEITIADFAFGDPITVAAGTEVTVSNVDGAPHSVTASEAGFTSGILDPGASGSFVAPSEPGTYAFVCAVHPTMEGELIVG